MGNNTLNLNTEIAENEEKIFSGSLIDLIMTFKESTMLIYEAILTDKKIMFIGESTTSCEKLTSTLMSLINLLQPLQGLIKRIHPYKNLYDLDFLKQANCIFGVTNPIFKMKQDYFDIMCEVETGQITASENFKKYLATINRETDLSFINVIIQKIKYEFLTEYEVERYFRLYTLNLLKILNSEEVYNDDETLINEVNKFYKRKTKIQSSFFFKVNYAVDKMFENLVNNGRSFKLIYSHLNSLNFRKNIEKEELFLIYNDIFKFLADERFIDYVIKRIKIFYFSSFLT